MHLKYNFAIFDVSPVQMPSVMQCKFPRYIYRRRRIIYPRIIHAYLGCSMNIYDNAKISIRYRNYLVRIHFTYVRYLLIDIQNIERCVFISDM